MSIETFYICDKCGKKQTDNKQFWTVGVSARPDVHPSNHFIEGKYLHVCRPCLESFGLYVQKKPEHEINPPKIPTVEELIVEIIQRCTN